MDQRGLLLGLMMLGVGLAGCLAEPTGDDDGTDDPNRAGGGGTGSGGVTPPGVGNVSAVWARVADGPVPRAEHCSANVDNVFYIMGGYVIANPQSAPGAAGGVPTGPPVNRVDIYDAKTDTWTDGPVFPAPLDHCLAEAVNGTIYVFYSNQAHKITPGETAWTKIPDPPSGHNAGVSGVIDDLIYVTGGGSTQVDVFNPANETWQTMGAAMPTRRDHTSGAVMDGKLYVIGGDVGGHSSNTNVTEVYDPVDDNWTTMAPLPVTRGSLHADAWNGLILVMGGQDGRTNVDAYNNVNAYDPITDTWSELDPLPSGRHGFAAGVWDGQLFVFAGAPQQGVSGFAQTHMLSMA